MTSAEAEQIKNTPEKILKIILFTMTPIQEVFFTSFANKKFLLKILGNKLKINKIRKKLRYLNLKNLWIN